MASGATTYEGDNPWGLYSKQLAILQMAFMFAVLENNVGSDPTIYIDPAYNWYANGWPYILTLDL